MEIPQMRSMHTRFAHVGRPSRNGGLFPIFKRAFKRTAKLADRRNTIAEAYTEYLAELHSDRMEAVEESERIELMEDTKRTSAEQAYRRDQRFLERMGEGTQFWEQSTNDRWTLRGVCWCEPDYYDHGAYDGYYSTTLATVTIDRAAQEWVVTTCDMPRGDEVRAPLIYAGLEGAQAMARALLLFATND